MQKFLQKLGICAAVVCVWGVCSLPAAAVEEPTDPYDNVVRMVTYFPVPYAVYNALFIKDKLDVGVTSENNFTLVIGSNGDTCADNFLHVPEGDAAYLRGSTTLQFDTDVYTPNVIVGDPTAASSDSPTVTLGKLRVGTGVLGNSSSGLGDASFSNNTVFKNIYMLTEAVNNSQLPTGCDGIGDVVKWQKINLDGTERYLLRCCEEGACGEGCWYPGETTENDWRDHYCVNGDWVSDSWWESGTWNDCECHCSADATLQSSQHYCKLRCDENSVKANHKSVCCQDASNTDTVCYAWKYRLTNTQVVESGNGSGCLNSGETPASPAGNGCTAGASNVTTEQKTGKCSGKAKCCATVRTYTCTAEHNGW